MSAGDDPHAVLGLSEGASLAEIRAAYRHLARQHHPDVAPGGEHHMVVVNRAYAALLQRRLAAGEPPPAPPEQPEAVDLDDGERSLWMQDLEVHGDDWRHMYEEERLQWERLLQGLAPGAAGRAEVEEALERTLRAQLVLENALRGARGLARLDREAFERRRAEELVALRGQARAGCLGIVLLAATLRVALAAVPPRRPARAVGSWRAR